MRVVLVAGGDDIPAGAPARNMIKRGHLPRDVVRLRVGRRNGGDEAKALRRHGERGKNRHRIHAIDPRDMAEGPRIIEARDPRAVGDEQHIELAALDGARRVDPAANILAAIASRAGRSPARHVIIAVAGHEHRQFHQALADCGRARHEWSPRRSMVLLPGFGRRPRADARLDFACGQSRQRRCGTLVQTRLNRRPPPCENTRSSARGRAVGYLGAPLTRNVTEAHMTTAQSSSAKRNRARVHIRGWMRAEPNSIQGRLYEPPVPPSSVDATSVLL